MISTGIAGTTEPTTRTVEFTYTLWVDSLPANPDSVNVWIPVPPNNTWQTVSGFQTAPPLITKTVRDAEYGNEFLKLDLTRLAAAAADKPVGISITWRITRKALNKLELIEPVMGGKVSSRYLKPDSHVPMDGKIAEEAQRVAGTKNTDQERARAIYDHIVTSMTYDKSGVGWGRGDAVYACDVRRGNCTDFHSLFIGEVRSLGIPARFIMGASLPPEPESTVKGYHCWAEFYVKDHGWIPVDASEACKHPEKREQLFGGLDADRIQLTMGRDIKIPGTHGEALNYALNPVVEVDGKTHTAVRREFRFKSIN